eukprot:scaffold162934_cov22-Prasinocladus_malaysianus.AAC.1
MEHFERHSLGHNEDYIRFASSNVDAAPCAPYIMDFKRWSTAPRSIRLKGGTMYEVRPMASVPDEADNNDHYDASPFSTFVESMELDGLSTDAWGLSEMSMIDLDELMNGIEHENNS